MHPKVTFSLMELSIPSSPPMGEPNRWTISGLTGHRSGNASIIVALALVSQLMISDFEWFSWKPSPAASSVTDCRSWRISSTAPP